MSVSIDLLANDLGLMFQDWQETVTYRRVSSTYDPTTQTRSETVTDTALPAIVRSVTSRTVPEGGGMAATADVDVLMRDAEMPERPPRRTSRIVHGGFVYQIVSYQRSVDGLAWQVRGRRV